MPCTDDCLSLFDTIKDECRAPVWSQGVKLARADAVNGVKDSGDELVFRVRVPVLAIDPSVVLYPKDAEWECDCHAKDDVCSHVAASIIALKQVREQGGDLPKSKQIGAHLEYKFSRSPRGLKLMRYIVDEKGESTLLRRPLMALVAQRAEGLPLSPSQDDLAVDRLLGAPNSLPVSFELMPRLLMLMSGMDHISLDGEPVEVSGDLISPKGLVETKGDGLRLTISADPQISETLGQGVVRIDKHLHPVSEVKLSGLSLGKLPIVQLFEHHQLGEFVSKVLPDLQQRFPVKVKSRRVPKMSKGDQPRLILDSKHKGASMTVTPLLVYGDPPRVRIDQGKMTYLQGQVPQRDLDAEKKLMDRLRNELNMVTGRPVTFEGRDVAVFSRRLQEWSSEALDDSQKPFNDTAELAPRLRADADNFDLWFELPSEGEELSLEPDADPDPQKHTHRYADAASVLGAWREGLELAPLQGGGWAPIPVEWLQANGHLLQDLLAARDEDKKISKVALPNLGALCANLDLPPPPEFGKLRPLLDGFEHIPEAPLPDDLVAELRSYQRSGYNWLHFLKGVGLGAVLADDMGLGKTLQALAVIDGATLVVCPTSVVPNWSAEVQHFRPSLKVNIYHGPQRKIDPEADITLTTYALLRLDLEKLVKIRWDMIVLDESQAIKNPDSQVARAAFALRGDFLLSLSGTPVENRLDELWSQFNFCNRGLLGGRRDFQQRYAQAVDAGEPGAAERLRSRIRPFILRRLKSAVAPELPPRTDAVLSCVLEENERLVYDTVRAATQVEVIKQLNQGGGVMAALEALLRLRQACCHPSLVPGQNAENSSKIKSLLEALESVVANQHKALVFSQWTSFLDLIEPHMQEANIDFLRLDGSSRNRGDLVKNFQSDDGPPVMLVSLKAGGTGLNLTAADHVFIMDPWWNPAVEDQAADRTHRIGQDKPVFVYRLVVQDSVEERILALQNKKRAIAEAALGGADQARGLTRDDLLALLQ